MSTVTEIKTAFKRLPEQDRRKLAEWIQENMEKAWDRQIEDDIAAGKLDKLAEQAVSHYKAGRVKPLDEIIDHP
jgi:hypothetical protein